MKVKDWTIDFVGFMKDKFKDLDVLEHSPNTILGEYARFGLAGTPVPGFFGWLCGLRTGRTEMFEVIGKSSVRVLDRTLLERITLAVSGYEGRSGISVDVDIVSKTIQWHD